MSPVRPGLLGGGGAEGAGRVEGKHSAEALTATRKRGLLQEKELCPAAVQRCRLFSNGFRQSMGIHRCVRCPSGKNRGDKNSVGFGQNLLKFIKIPLKSGVTVRLEYNDQPFAGVIFTKS